MAVGCRPLVVYFNANDTLARVEQNVRIARSVRESGRRFLTKASHQTKQGNSLDNALAYPCNGWIFAGGHRTSIK